MIEVTNKQIERWKSVTAGCDHTKHTEMINDTKVCFCTKLANVIQARAKVTPQEFSEAIGQHTLANLIASKNDTEAAEGLSQAPGVPTRFQGETHD